MTVTTIPSLAVGSGTSITSVSTGSVNWSNSSSSMRIEGGLDITGSLTVQGQDLQELLNQINDRLAILVPDEDKLKKFAALKQAYDNYKLLEQLCRDEDNK